MFSLRGYSNGIPSMIYGFRSSSEVDMRSDKQISDVASILSDDDNYVGGG